MRRSCVRSMDLSIHGLDSLFLFLFRFLFSFPLPFPLLFLVATTSVLHSMGLSIHVWIFSLSLAPVFRSLNLSLYLSLIHLLSLSHDLSPNLSLIPSFLQLASVGLSDKVVSNCSYTSWIIWPFMSDVLCHLLFALLSLSLSSSSFFSLFLFYPPPFSLYFA
jgi:hypothetical protein